MPDVPADMYARILALEAQVARLTQHMGLAPLPIQAQTGPDPRFEIAEIIRVKGKIPAIKRYRDLYGASLADAKRAVEDIEAATRGPISG